MQVRAEEMANRLQNSLRAHGLEGATVEGSEEWNGYSFLVKFKWVELYTRASVVEDDKAPHMVELLALTVMEKLKEIKWDDI